MKKVIAGIVLLLLLSGILFFLGEKSDEQQIEEIPFDMVTEKTTYTLKVEGLAFAYQDGPTGYHLEARDIPNPPLIREIILTPTSDYEDQQNRVGGEGSPAISIQVYENSLRQSPNNWITENPSASNIQLAKGTPVDVVVGGANGVEYEIDGLYPARVIVVAHGGFMFVVTGQYLDETSMTYRDFDAFVNSFTFVPPSSQM